MASASLTGGAVGPNVSTLVAGGSSLLGAGKLKLAAGVVLVAVMIGLGISGATSPVAAPSMPVTTPDDSPTKTPRGRVDGLGDALPERAMRRLGTSRFRHGNQIMALACSADGRTIATGGMREIRLWDSASGCLRKILRTDEYVFGLGFSADGSQLVSAGTAVTGHGNAPRLVIWDTARGKPLRTVTHNGAGSNRWVRSAAITADGKTVAMSCDDGSVQIIDVSTGEVRHNLGSEGRIASAVTFSPDGQGLAAAGDRNAVCVWDVTTGAERVRFPDAADLRNLTFSPDGQLLATAHAKGSFEEGTIRVWDLAAKRQKWSVQAGSGKAYSGGILTLVLPQA
jgi:WD40 repeat protein